MTGLIIPGNIWQRKGGCRVWIASVESMLPARRVVEAAPLRNQVSRSTASHNLFDK